MQAYTSVPSSASLRRSGSNTVVMGGKGRRETHCVRSSLFPSTPHLLLGLTPGEAKFLSSITLKPLEPANVPTWGLTPRELIKSFLLTDPVVSLRGILEKKSPHLTLRTRPFP